MKLLTALLCAALAFVGCTLSTPQQEVTPTFPVTFTSTPPTSTATLTPSLTPTALEIAQVQLESPTATYTAGSPTETPTPTPTLGPYEYTIQPGDQLIAIVRDFGYRTLDILDDVVALNDMVSADILPPPGTVLLIPRQTATPVPLGVEQTVQARATIGVNAEGLPDYPVDCHTVRAGETMIGIALDYNMTLEQLDILNPDIPFFGCDFDEVGGGPGCNPPIVENQCVYVFLPTPTPTLSPTPSGSETPTATPTYVAPIVSYPAEGALVPAGLLRLQWVSVGVLRQGEVYLIQVTDTTTGLVYPSQVSQQTSLLLPAEMIPTDGQTHVFQWSVSVAKPNEQGAYRIFSGTTTRTFQWQSR
jgi:LysM repeat protein